MTIIMEWLQEQLTLEQADIFIEKSQRGQHYQAKLTVWLPLREALREGDTIWTYLHERPDFRRDWTQGIAVVRDGKIIGDLVTDVNP